MKLPQPLIQSSSSVQIREEKGKLQDKQRTLSKMMSPQVNFPQDVLVTKNEFNRDPGVSSQSQSTGSRSRSTASKSRNSKGSSVGHHSDAEYGTDSDANNSTVMSKRTSSGTENPLPHEKSVRFNEIHIRDYERTVGDNPSCSSGPPIGIGWAHGNTRVLNINHYEAARQLRRKQSHLVLNRRNREALLAYWQVPVNDVVEAIRGNIRVKNQRRQTVTNLGKVEKIEEAFESAARKLKKALLLRRRTEGKAKGYQVHNRVAPSGIMGTRKLNEGPVLKTFGIDKGPVERRTEEQDIGIPGPGSRFWRLSTNDHVGNSPSEMVYENEDTSASASSLSGFTLGNSTTASAIEMEKFYRELELEMFGDMELPSMVGQTLEVPGVDIPEEARVYYSDAISFVERRMFDNSDRNGFPGDQPSTWNNRDLLEQRGASGIRHSQDGDLPSSSSVTRQMNHTTRIPQYFHDQNREASCPPANTDAPYVDYRLSRSLQSLDLNPQPSIRPLLGHRELHFHPSSHPPSMRLHGPGLPNGINSYQDTRQRVQRDAPEIRHLPLQGQICPTRFMEDGDNDGPSTRPALDAVIISEDMLHEDQILLFGAGQMYGLNHAPNLQYPHQLFHPL